jgi:hypothetical protein
MQFSSNKLQPARFEVERKTFDTFHESLQTKYRWNRRLTQMIGFLGIVVMARAILWFACVELPTSPSNASPVPDDRLPVSNPYARR